MFIPQTPSKKQAIILLIGAVFGASAMFLLMSNGVIKTSGFEEKKHVLEDDDDNIEPEE